MARRVLHDAYFKKAKAEGYVARSAYKLIEIQERFRLFGAGARVLDLGCSPGSWLQVAGEIVGPRGRVVGIDLQPVELDLPVQVTAQVGDAFDIDPATLTGVAGGLFDAVVSDMAPNTTGAGDHFRSVRLCRRVLEIVPHLLRPGGTLAMKVFEGEQYPALVKEVGAMFREARGFKPKACRDVSFETYIVGLGRRRDLARAEEAEVRKGPPPAPAGW